ncbi:chemotaxis protein CheA, partial [Pseudomonas sp. ODNR1LW]|nr:chemotaxis protein CheA [Pseudomonas sp. ODNR1LW]
MDAFEAIKATFFQECDELLAELESKLMLLEQGQTDLETINAVFRAVHSVKGGAGAFGLEALVRFAHVFETLMDELRAGRKPCDPVTIKTLLRASDVLADHIQAAQGLVPPVDEERSAGLVHELQVLTHGEEAPPVAEEEDEDDFGFTPMAFDAPLDAPLPELPDLGAPAAEAAGSEAQVGWRILFKPHSRMYG